MHLCTGLLAKAILLPPGPNHDFVEQSVGQKRAKKMPLELASLLHTDASSLEEGEENRSSREATPALSKAPSTSTVQDLEERKVTIMFEFLIEQQQKRGEERGREATRERRLGKGRLQRRKRIGRERRRIGKRETGCGSLVCRR